MQDHDYIVRVTADTQEQAKRVIAERVDHDEDYGFDYRVQVVPGYAEAVPVVRGMPLRLSFAPDAIREHFEIDEECEDDDKYAWVADLDEEALSEIAVTALVSSDWLYSAFAEALTDAADRYRSNHREVRDGT